MDKFMAVLHFIGAEWQRVLTGDIIVACSIIFVLGLFKKAWLGKIGNKLVRKLVLATASLVLVFPATAIYFVSDNLSFDYYWYGCAIGGFSTIITYFFYENYLFRDLIDIIGKNTVGKWWEAFKVAMADRKSKKQLKAELVKATETLQETVREEVRKEVLPRAKTDEDLSDV